MVIVLDDFKPPSVDTSRTAEVQIGSTNECTVTIPNVHVRFLFLLLGAIGEFYLTGNFFWACITYLMCYGVSETS